MNIKYNILNEINKDSKITQRKLASKCNISLGNVNFNIINFIKEKYIIKNNNIYTLTDKGINYLDDTIKNNQEERIINANITPTKVAIILASNNKELFKSNLDYIKRLIRQLNEFKINDIYVISGYKYHNIETSIQNVTHIYNENYSWTNSMYSLSLLPKNKINNSLIFYGDSIIENIGIEKLIESNYDNVFLTTAENDYNDSIFFESKNNMINNISKDSTHLKKIDGELVGAFKVSKEFLNKLINEYNNDNNPMITFEHMCLDLAKRYYLKSLFIDGLLWAKNDSIDKDIFIKNKLIKKIEKKEESIKLNNLKNIVSECLKIELDQIQGIEPIGGMTNKNYKVTINNINYVLRIPGTGTTELINRSNEYENAKFAFDTKVDAELIYFSKETGIKVSKFIENATTQTPKSAKKYKTMLQTTSILRRLHKIEKKMPTDFDIYFEINKYDKLISKYNITPYNNYKETKDIVLNFKNILNDIGFEITPCHNDLVAENFIVDSEENMYLIDWEYAGNNDPMWDLAAHMLECNFNQEECNLFCNLYFEQEPTINHKQRILIYMIYQDFLWSQWTLIKEAQGDNFESYGIDRYNNAINNINKFNREYNND